MDFPSSSNPWDGYLVLGCKFQIKPSGVRKKDADWAIQQLESDLKKFTNRKRKLQKPDYYLFATNVALTAAAGSGGRDRTEALLEKYKAKLGLRAFGVWDYNDIRGFLDGDADLRAAYGHFLSAGDVLTRLASTLSLKRPDFMDVMHAFLQKELVADMAAKLQSAGEDPETQIPLARVFVDLPFADNAEAAALGTTERHRKVQTIINTMLAAGSSVLRRAKDRDAEPPNRCQSRFVIIGGPGQGKSTLGQYLCQLYRASLLKDRPRQRLDDRAAAIINQLEKQRKQSGGMPLARRFPVRIELRTFAHVLAAESSLTLLEYLRRDFARLGGANVSMEDVKTWLSTYPWVVLLDGLDEVPPSSNRSEVMREIENFRIDAASQNSDVLTIATTRPQSYTNEFSKELFEHLYLLPLSAEEALHYGRRLAEARCGADERRCDELTRSLEKACKNESTARLMQSPLQVTIMATLLEETGEPPQQRYRLFAEYYRTIYKRETRRRLLGGILSERQTDIDTVHAQAGLLLQAVAERGVKRVRGRPEESEAALSDDQFRKLVRKRLHYIGIADPKLTEILNRITDSTLQRLVFLVRQVEGWVRFDVTSFKEFMAAEAVMAENDEIVRDRLEALAPFSYWRNVFLFAVGKCFVQREHMLDNIVEICAGLNEEMVSERVIGSLTSGKAAKAVLWGSRLSIDILSDGTARQFPEYEIRLARIALELLCGSDVESSIRLAAVYHEDLSELFREAVVDRLGQANFWAQLSAWHLLLSLAERGVAWALELLQAKWPQDHVFGRAIVSSRERRAIIGWPRRFVIDLGTKIPPHWLARYVRDPSGGQQLPEPWRGIASFILAEKHTFEAKNRSEWRAVLGDFEVAPSRIAPEWAGYFSGMSLFDPGWIPYVAGARFGEHPSAKRLAVELRVVAANWDRDKPSWLRAWSWLRALPWPLGACIAASNTKEDIEEFAVNASEGKLGDAGEWQAAETRWKNHGVTDSDIAAMSDASWPFDSSISEAGFPFALFEWPSAIVSGREIRGEEVRLSLSKLPNLPARMRSWVSRIILRLMEYPGYYHSDRQRTDISPKDYQAIYSFDEGGDSGDWGCWLDRWLISAKAEGFSDEWLEFLEWLGRSHRWFHFRGEGSAVSEVLVDRFCANPEKWKGLLFIIVAIAVSGQCPQLPVPVLDKARKLGARERIEADILALGRQDVSASQIDAITRDMRRSWSSNRDVWRGLEVAGSVSLEQGARVALALLEDLHNESEAASDTTEHARRRLVDYLTRTPSRLDVQGVWEKLKFPPRLE